MIPHRKVDPKKVPPPGSPEALARGCVCQVLDNGHGCGYMGMPGIYVYRLDCPLHHPPGGLTDREAGDVPG
jgi:hypothetical protein